MWDPHPSSSNSPFRLAAGCPQIPRSAPLPKCVTPAPPSNKDCGCISQRYLGGQYAGRQRGPRRRELGMLRSGP
eukprot:scaffold730_cov365-Pinguiococcus_pyrenoidosus.AAC.9